MSERQEVILYRSPAEAWWWDHPEEAMTVSAVVLGIVVVIWLYGEIRAQLRNRR